MSKYRLWCDSRANIHSDVVSTFASDGRRRGTKPPSSRSRTEIRFSRPALSAIGLPCTLQRGTCRSSHRQVSHGSRRRVDKSQVRLRPERLRYSSKPGPLEEGRMMAEGGGVAESRGVGDSSLTALSLESSSSPSSGVSGGVAELVARDFGDVGSSV